MLRSGHVSSTSVGQYWRVAQVPRHRISCLFRDASRLLRASKVPVFRVRAQLTQGISPELICPSPASSGSVPHKVRNWWNERTERTSIDDTIGRQAPAALRRPNRSPGSQARSRRDDPHIPLPTPPSATYSPTSPTSRPPARARDPPHCHTRSQHPPQLIRGRFLRSPHPSASPCVCT